MTDRKTIETYDNSAHDYAKYFNSIGARVVDIDRGIGLLKTKNNIKAVEIGCGNGRDGVEIVKRVSWYQGFDPSEKLLEIAKNNIDPKSLVLADDMSYEYPENIDIIFSFASLLHTNKNDLKIVFEKVHRSLRRGGIFYVSLKEADEYKKIIKKDAHGERVFYLYNLEILRDIAGKDFEIIYKDNLGVGDAKWLNIAFRKI